MGPLLDFSDCRKTRWQLNSSELHYCFDLFLSHNLTVFFFLLQLEK